jgi:uncharacterized membrane protein
MAEAAAPCGCGLRAARCHSKKGEPELMQMPSTLSSSLSETNRPVAGPAEQLHPHLLQWRFPVFRHEHPAVIDVNRVHDEQLTMGQRIADAVAAFVGSWPFIIGQSFLLALWLVLNSVAWFYHWDPYPFILLNLTLSFQAAYAAPFVMMSQNRQAEKDRLTAQNDYLTDCKGEEEVRHMMEHLDHQDVLILQVLQRLEEQQSNLKAQHGEILKLLHEIAPGRIPPLVAEQPLAGEPAAGEQGS